MGIARIGLISTASVAVGGFIGALIGFDGSEELISEIGENIGNITEAYADLYEIVPLEAEEIFDFHDTIRELNPEHYKQVEEILSNAQFGLLSEEQIIQGLPALPQNITESNEFTDTYREAYEVISNNLGDINQAGTVLGENATELIDNVKKPALIGSAIAGGSALIVSSATDKPDSWTDKLSQSRSELQTHQNRR